MNHPITLMVGGHVCVIIYSYEQYTYVIIYIYTVTIYTQRLSTPERRSITACVFTYIVGIFYICILVLCTCIRVWGFDK